MAVVTPAARIGKTTGEAMPKRKAKLPRRAPVRKAAMKVQKRPMSQGLINR